MRKTALILAGLLVATSVVAMAATAPAADASKDKGTAAAPADNMGGSMDKAPAKGKAKWDHVTGDITAADPAAKTFTVKAKSGDKNLKWDDKTVVTPKGQTPNVGDHVTVTTAAGSDVATKVAIHKAKAAAAKKS
ncbi:MAG TPA: hypothetical protein VMM92_14440 [Thermoanaerobaculia bacterium]|nr:hypothetical protein [Thermoanaerobaculia bacterium]